MHHSRPAQAHATNNATIRRFRTSPEPNPAALGRLCRDDTVNRAGALDRAQCSARMQQATWVGFRVFQRVESDPVVSPDGPVRLRTRLGACVERTLPAYAQNPVKFGDTSLSNELAQVPKRHILFTKFCFEIFSKLHVLKFSAQ